MKLNVGCGFNKLDGYLNIDKEIACEPDMVFNVDVNPNYPWPWPDDHFEEVRFWHSLEHMGETFAQYKHIIQQVYRVCKPGATVIVAFPHHRHDSFHDDPIHVRALTSNQFFLLSKEQCDEWSKEGSSNTLLAHYLGVDFRPTNVDMLLDQKWFDVWESGRVTQDQIDKAAVKEANVISEIHVTLKVIE